MSFDRPDLLWLLMLPAIALAIAIRRPGLRVVLPVDHGRMGLPRWLARLIGALQTLPALMLALAILVLAGPRTLERIGGSRLLTNIEVCLDLSGSMKFPFGERRRFDAAIDALARFTQRRAGDAFGLTVFSEHVVHWLPLTDHLDAIQRAAPFLDPDKIGAFSRGTYIKKALTAARERLVERHTGDRVIVLISDGEPSDFDEGDSTLIAAALAEAGIVTMVVHVAPGPVPDVMVEIAETTGGIALAADNEAKLQQVFARFDRMRPVRYGAPRYRPVAHYGPIAAAGLVLGLLYLCSLLGLRYTPW